MALERVVEVTRDCSSKAVLAWRVTQFRVPCAVHLSRSNLRVPLCLLKLVRTHTHDNMSRKKRKPHNLHPHDPRMHSPVSVLLCSAQSSCIAQSNQGRAENRQRRNVNHDESNVPSAEWCEIFLVHHASSVTAPTYTLSHIPSGGPWADILLGSAVIPTTTCDKPANLSANT
jgi:hypothetical protein